MIKHISKIT